MSGGPLLGFMRQLRRVVGGPGDGLADVELLRRWVAHRDEAAFEALVWRHGPMVLGLCRRLLRRGADVEDAFQATFLLLVRKADTVRAGEAVGAWLYRVAYCVALRARAGEAARARRQAAVAPPHTVGPDDAADWRDLRPVLDEEINRLPQRYRAAFVLCCLQGKTNSEAARELGCPVGTILSRLAWARQRLRQRLTRRGVGMAGLAAPATAAVPPSVAGAALRTAFSGGQTASPHTLTLTQGVLRTMSLAKLKALTLVVAGALVAGTGWFALAASPAEAPRAAERKSEKEDKPEVGMPKGWFGGSANADAYESGIDRKAVHGGKASAYVGMKDAADNDFGTLGQAIQAKAYLGKRVRLTGYVKTDDAEQGAALWMRVDGKGATLAFDNMDDRRVKGTKGWTKCDVVLFVPEKATTITFGMLLSGKGRAWLDDVVLEVVGRDVKTTNILEKELPQEGAGDDMNLPEKPTNLDFEEGLDGEAKPDRPEPLTATQADWLKKRAIPFDTAEPGKGVADLSPLKALVGKARVVSLGEATHGTSECFKMKHA
jgi:RNA polymerase sigma factor (sigma-70 family)